MKQIKYSNELKLKAAELFSLVDSNGQGLFSGKKLAQELGVSTQTAFYLEYEGRKFRGYKATRKNKTRKPTIKEISSFVENNIYSSEEDTSVRDSLVLVAITVAVCFTVTTFVINYLINLFV